ncbi:type III polyketide synthase [Rhodocaloribacter litoris]|uniref:type III polyketide synthase n=1 Tax=Rhodocaloribacter litoris TaxID=2558931 RepID=UPI00141F3D61|nr:type III polyketide synthase [Rhodocaloribacter litoris]QXD16607.1 type III polyketide synthase [Rhodocaloribacter litoris]
MPTTLEAIATANPPLRRSQAYAASFMQRVDSQPEGIRRRIPQLYARSGIDYRYSCVEDYVREPADWTFFPPNWSLRPEPTTAARNRKYREAAVPLAEQVARAVLRQAGLAPEAVTHVVAVSCTGFFAPGLDVELVRRLGMRPDTRRVIVGFMGCYAAFNALRLAHGFCRSDPAARVLVVCVELCTLHFQASQTLESAVINALFSDGAAAAVLAARPDAGGRLTYAGDHCLLDGDSLDDMTWDVGDNGFLMGLSSRVPDVLARQLPAFVEALLGRHGLTPGDVDFWAIHPGGRAIVERAQEVLGLSDEAVHDSLEVLRLHGNMSSPTIFFVLKRFLDRHEAARARGEAGYRTGLAVAFGPGLTLEGCLWRRGAG